MKVKTNFNPSGLPRFTDEERLILRKKMRELYCKVCHAKPGEPCKEKLFGPDAVHMGRIPHGFDTAEAVWGPSENWA